MDDAVVINMTLLRNVKKEEMHYVNFLLFMFIYPYNRIFKKTICLVPIIFQIL